MDKQDDMMDDEVLDATEEPTTCSNADLLQSFKKHKIDIGQDYHLTEEEIIRINEEAQKNLKELQEQYNKAIKAKDLALESGNVDLVSMINKDKADIGASPDHRESSYKGCCY